MKIRKIASFRASFSEDEDEGGSTWTVSLPQGEYSFSISELFPSGEYDIHQVKSAEFGTALTERLRDSPDKISDMLRRNTRFINISELSTDPERTASLVSRFIPLNDSEKIMRDELRDNGS